MVLGISGLTIDPRLARGMYEDLGEEPSSDRMRKVRTQMPACAAVTCNLWYRCFLCHSLPQLPCARLAPSCERLGGDPLLLGNSSLAGHAPAMLAW